MKILECRRSRIAILAIVCLTGLGVYHKMDVSMAISGIVLSIAGSNAYEKKK